MANNSSIAERIGQAWSHHRDGRHTEALAEFDAILRQNPDDIDANYGAGLVQKALNQLQAAETSFRKTLALVETARKDYEAQRAILHAHDNVKTPEDDRFTMLIRMINQRLSEISGTSVSES